MANNIDEGSELWVNNDMNKAARRAQERVENTREIADALYVWNARAMSGPSCMMLTGDYCMSCDGGMAGSRGAFIPMSPEELSAMIDSGALSKVFNPDDMNSPDFDEVMGSVFAKYSAQASFKDAAYYAHTHKGKNVAVYGADTGDATAVSIENDGISVETKFDESGVESQCTYETFNPGGAVLSEAMNTFMPDESSPRSSDELFKQLKEEYGENGGVDPEPYEEPLRPEYTDGYDDLSPMEKLSAEMAYEDATKVDEPCECADCEPTYGRRRL